MKFKIDKGVEIPGRPANGRGRKAIYPWEEMEVGDSFFIEYEGDKRRQYASIAGHASKRYGKKFTARTFDNGVRIWRIE